MSTHGILFNIQRMSVHDGPGIRTTVFFKGCPLHCLWCSNPESMSMHPQLMFFRDLCTDCGHCLQICPANAAIMENDNVSRDFARCLNCGVCASQCPSTASSLSGREYEIGEVMDFIRKDITFYRQSGGGVTFSGGECTMQGEFLTALLGQCLDEGVHTCVDTCGYTDKNLFRRLIDLADLFLFDIKHMDTAKHKRITGVNNERILDNLRMLLEVHSEKACIRIPLMPNLNDSEENIATIASLLNKYNIRHVDVLPYHAFGRNKYRALMRRQPEVLEYKPEDLQTVLRRFSLYGVETEIV